MLLGVPILKHVGVNSFFKELTPFSKGFVLHRSKQEVRKVVSFSNKMAENMEMYPCTSRKQYIVSHTTCISITALTVKHSRS